MAGPTGDDGQEPLSILAYKQLPDWSVDDHLNYWRDGTRPLHPDLVGGDDVTEHEQVSRADWSSEDHLRWIQHRITPEEHAAGMREPQPRDRRLAYSSQPQSVTTLGHARYDTGE